MEISSDGSRAADYPQLGEHGKHGFLLRRRRGRSNGWATVVVRGGAGVEGKRLASAAAAASSSQMLARRDLHGRNASVSVSLAARSPGRAGRAARRSPSRPRRLPLSDGGVRRQDGLKERTPVYWQGQNRPDFIMFVRTCIRGAQRGASGSHTSRKRPPTSV